ncbi:hypothetical protein EXN22_04060 [Pseudomonas tructae]|uniref:Uncharacterized protein n=1 Tax=Pseudomonas tructae TaxID=2518644 RepID=A0A411MDZ8_9PSED|nr:hypothetical protein [Pseudomonas tructae]QBF24909.1 hypothetical protein EXN22_04060 [Pseudomonas tructae]
MKLESYVLLGVEMAVPVKLQPLVWEVLLGAPQGKLPEVLQVVTWAGLWDRCLAHLGRLEVLLQVGLLDSLLAARWAQG